MFKKIILALCVLVLCITVSSAGIIEKLKQVVAQKSEAAGGATYFLNETFNQIGYDEGTCGTDDCWTETISTGVVDEDDSPGHNSTTYALRVQDADSSFTTFTIAAADVIASGGNLYWQSYFKRNNTDGSNSVIIGFRESDLTYVAALRLFTDVWRCEYTGGTTDDGTAPADDGTECMLWVHIYVGTGLNGQINAYFDCSVPYSRPAADCAISDGTSTGTIAKILIAGENGHDNEVDEIKVSTTHWDSW